MFQRTTAINKLLRLSARKKVIQGGTSAGKTYGIIPILIDYATKNPRHLITVVAESIPAVRNGAVKIFQDVMYDTNRWIQDHWRSNPMEYKFSNGATIQFTSFDNAGKAKAAGKRDILFLNEANHINFDIADALMVRSNSIWIDFNPDHEFWAHTETLKEPDSEFLLLTYKDNEGLPPEILQELLIRQEKAKTNDYWANWCKVYIDGEIGVIQGAIFQNWSIGEFDTSLPHVYGLDFGFSCFIADTLITTDKGQKRIADIKVGDLVLTEKGYNKVLKVHNNGTKKVVEKNIELDFGLINISCTLEHKFKVNNEWKQYKNLQSKDILTTNVFLTEKNTKGIQTESIKTVREYEAEVFDLTIENEHNYFANGILVHNCDPDSLIKVAVDKKRKLIYASEVLYKTGNSTEQLTKLLHSNLNPSNSLVVADSADPRTINDLRQKQINIIPATKGPDSVRNGIKRLQDYEIIVTSTSTNLIKELRNYVWHDKKSEMPIDAYNHQIDPLRYAFDKLVPQSTMYISGM